MDAEIGGLEAQQTRAFDNILAGAQQRGLGFSGIPVGEQAEYTASEFLPAVARVRSSGNEVKSSLFGALADINRSQRSEASGLRQQELDRAEQIRQFNAQLAAQRDAERRAAARAASEQTNFASLLGGGGAGGGGAAQPAANMAPKSDGSGFAFTDQRGRAISAAKYAQLTGTNISEVLKYMGQQGDRYAANAYNWLQRVRGMDFVNTPEKLLQVAQRNYAPLFWGAD